MASLGEFRPPNQIDKDEDLYGKFTKTQLIYIGIGLLIGVFEVRILSCLHITIITIFSVVIAGILMLAGAVIGGVTIGDIYYLKGGGLRIDQYLIRKVKKRFNKELYTQAIDPELAYQDSEKEKTSLLLRILKKNTRNDRRNS